MGKGKATESWSTMRIVAVLLALLVANEAFMAPSSSKMMLSRSTVDAPTLQMFSGRSIAKPKKTAPKVAKKVVKKVAKKATGSSSSILGKKSQGDQKSIAQRLNSAVLTEKNWAYQAFKGFSNLGAFNDRKK